MALRREEQVDSHLNNYSHFRSNNPRSGSPVPWCSLGKPRGKYLISQKSTASFAFFFSGCWGVPFFKKRKTDPSVYARNTRIFSPRSAGTSSNRSRTLPFTGGGAINSSPNARRASSIKPTQFWAYPVLSQNQKCLDHSRTVVSLLHEPSWANLQPGARTRRKNLTNGSNLVDTMIRLITFQRITPNHAHFQKLRDAKTCQKHPNFGSSGPLCN